MQQDRRTFFHSLAAMTAGLMLGETGLGSDGPARDRLGQLLPRRQFGRTGENLTMLALGGWHIGRMSEKQAQQTIEAALESGVRFFDNAEQYADGVSEQRYGKFLSPKYRDVAFIMTKTRAVDADAARRDLEGSLRRLNVDTIDLWQIHSLTSEADAEQRLDNGVLDVMHQAQKEGKVRYIGFTGHTTYKSHVRMLERWPEADSVQMPINVVDPLNKSFIRNVMPLAMENNVAPIAMKTLANGGLFGGSWNSDGPGGLIPNVLSVEQAMRFVWSLPTSITVTGADDPAMIREKCDMVRRFQQLSETERQALIDRVQNAVDDYSMEYYKA
jgi:predicted aldo/keto reductase-like oxidoreductase